MLIFILLLSPRGNEILTNLKMEDKTFSCNLIHKELNGKNEKKAEEEE